MAIAENLRAVKVTSVLGETDKAYKLDIQGTTEWWPFSKTDLYAENGELILVAESWLADKHPEISWGYWKDMGNAKTYTQHATDEPWGVDVKEKVMEPEDEEEEMEEEAVEEEKSTIMGALGGILSASGGDAFDAVKLGGMMALVQEMGDGFIEVLVEEVFDDDSMMAMALRTEEGKQVALAGIAFVLNIMANSQKIPGLKSENIAWMTTLQMANSTRELSQPQIKKLRKGFGKILKMAKAIRTPDAASVFELDAEDAFFEDFEEAEAAAEAPAEKVEKVVKSTKKGA